MLKRWIDVHLSIGQISNPEQSAPCDWSRYHYHQMCRLPSWSYPRNHSFPLKFPWYVVHAPTKWDMPILCYLRTGTAVILFHCRSGALIIVIKILTRIRLLGLKFKKIRIQRRCCSLRQSSRISCGWEIYHQSLSICALSWASRRNYCHCWRMILWASTGRKKYYH